MSGLDMAYRQFAITPKGNFSINYSKSMKTNNSSIKDANIKTKAPKYNTLKFNVGRKPTQNSNLRKTFWFQID